MTGIGGCWSWDRGRRRWEDGKSGGEKEKVRRERGREDEGMGEERGRKGMGKRERGREEKGRGGDREVSTRGWMGVAAMGRPGKDQEEPLLL